MPDDAERCREHAKECWAWAASTNNPSVKESLTDLAKRWTRLATALEASRILSFRGSWKGLQCQVVGLRARCPPQVPCTPRREPEEAPNSHSRGFFLNGSPIVTQVPVAAGTHKPR